MWRIQTLCKGADHVADPVARLQGGIQYFSQYLMLISSFLEGAKVYSENGWGPLPDLTLVWIRH